MAKPRIIEETLAAGAHTKFDIQPNVVVTYLNRARQFAKHGPGLTEFECPLINISDAEKARFIAELAKTMPDIEVRVLRGSGGVGIFVSTVDPHFVTPADQQPFVVAIPYRTFLEGSGESDIENGRYHAELRIPVRAASYKDAAEAVAVALSKLVAMK
jgi:hypothetical protein